MAERLILATRGSKLATTQSGWVARQLEDAHPGLEVALVIIRTSGDAAPDVPLPSIGGKGLFTREIEEALLAGEADLAVHSLKDLPIESPPSLALGALPERVDPRDALISRSGEGLVALPSGARIGTSSLRRIAQLAHHRPDLVFVPIRGNVDTRLRKLQEQDFAAIILAGAGLTRLGLQDRVTEWLSPEICLPAPGQGILAVQVREGDERVGELVGAINSEDAAACATAERSALEGLGGGCQTPAGFLATVSGGICHLQGAIVAPAGNPYYRAELSGPREQAADLGKRLAEQLLAAGANALIV